MLRDQLIHGNHLFVFEFVEPHLTLFRVSFNSSGPRVCIKYIMVRRFQTCGKDLHFTSYPNSKMGLFRKGKKGASRLDFRNLPGVAS